MIKSNQTTFRTGDNFITDTSNHTTVTWSDYTSIQRIYNDPCPRYWLSATYGTTTNRLGAFLGETKCNPTSISEINNNFSNSIFPNPITDFIKINVDEKFNTNIFDISLINIEGKILFKENVQSKNNQVLIKLPNYFVNGIYFLQIKNTKNEYTNHKILIAN